MRDLVDTQLWNNATLRTGMALPDCVPYYGHGRKSLCLSRDLMHACISHTLMQTPNLIRDGESPDGWCLTDFRPFTMMLL